MASDTPPELPDLPDLPDLPELSDTSPSDHFFYEVQTGRFIPLKDDFSIGRKEGDFQVPESSSISSRHLTVKIHGEKIFIIDHHSKNLTRVNSIQIPSEREFELKDLDLVILGDHAFLYTQTNDLSKIDPSLLDLLQGRE